MIRADETLFLVVDELHSNSGVGVSKIAVDLCLLKSAVHKHLKTLEKHEFVHNEDGTYRLGLKFLAYGGKVRDDDLLYDLGRAKVQDLADEINELGTLSIKEFDRGVFLFRCNGQYNLKKTIPLGNRFYLHQNGAGKTVLAELHDREIDRIVDDHLPGSIKNTITDPGRLREEISRIRERGFALKLGERDAEVSAISAAVRDPSTGGLGAISVSLPSSIVQRNDIAEEYVEPITQTASKLSLRLKYS